VTSTSGFIHLQYLRIQNIGVIATRWLIIADSSPDGIFSEKCLKLSQMHSDAVDFPKTGVPIPFTAVPRPDVREKPDWSAPETLRSSRGYYQSTKAIGRLYRAIDLQPLDRSKESEAHPLMSKQMSGVDALVAGMANLEITSGEKKISQALRTRIADLVDLESDDDDIDVSHLAGVFEQYKTELRNICARHSISESRRGGALSEEEVVIGTIIAKAHEKRRRERAVAAIRDQSTRLVNWVSEQLSGPEDADDTEWLRRAWAAWRLSVVEVESRTFGAQSFGLIVLGSIFEAIRAVEHNFMSSGL
jgi:RNA-dependent RNA polymerase